MTAQTTSETTPAPATGEPRRTGTAARGQWWRSQALIVWVLLLVCLPLSRLASASFPSIDLVVNVIILGLFLAVIAFGQGLVVLTGGIDLSVASSVALGAYLTGSLWAGGFPVPAAIAVGVVACAAVGALNGVIVSRFGFPAFIVTLAVGTILASVLLGVARGAPAQRSPEGLAALFRQDTTVLGVPVAVWLFVVVAAVGLFIQHKTTLGIRAYALGNSVAAARNARVNVNRVTVSVYAVAGAAYGLAGVMLLGYSSGADLNVGEPWLLPSIAAVVVWRRGDPRRVGHLRRHARRCAAADAAGYRHQRDRPGRGLQADRLRRGDRDRAARVPPRRTACLTWRHEPGGSR